MSKHDPVPPDDGSPFFPPWSTWRVTIRFEDGHVVHTEVDAQTYALAYATASDIGNGMYPEGGGIADLNVRFKCRKLTV